MIQTVLRMDLRKDLGKEDQPQSRVFVDAAVLLGLRGRLGLLSGWGPDSYLSQQGDSGAKCCALPPWSLISCKVRVVEGCQPLPCSWLLLSWPFMAKVNQQFQKKSVARAALCR